MTKKIVNPRIGSEPTENLSLPHTENDPLNPIIQGNWIWCPLKCEWRILRPEGKTDPENELPDILTSWRKYSKQPDSIAVDVTKSVFKIQWSKLDRWDPSSFRPIEWRCSNEFLRPIGEVLKKRCELVDRDEIDFSDLTPITIHFDGSVEPRDMTDTDDYTMDPFFCKTRRYCSFKN